MSDKTQEADQVVVKLLESLGEFSELYDTELKDSLSKEVRGDVREKIALLGVQVIRFHRRLIEYREDK